MLKFKKNTSFLFLLSKHYIILAFLSTIFFIFVTYVNYQHAVSYSFIDEYNNFVAGYFLLQGKHLYTQIFFQHNPLMAYISFALQYLLHPSTLYQLVLYHRMFILFFAIAWNIFFIIRFGFVGLGFSVLFELCKYYMFGGLFLAESVIVYPLVYIFFLNVQALTKRHIYNVEIIISGFLIWFCVWMREPLIPLALFLYAVLLFLFRKQKSMIYSLTIFIVLTIVVLLTTDLSAYYLQVFKVNYVSVASGEMSLNGLEKLGILKIFFYPILLFFGGVWNVFRTAAICIDVVFLVVGIYMVTQKKLRNIVIFSVVCLGLAAIRLVPPGTSFYEAYHMTVWYGLFFASVILELSLLATNIKLLLIVRLISCVLFISVAYVFFISPSYLHEHIDRQTAFSKDYSKYYLYGQTIHDLSSPGSTIFVDAWDSLIYWQAKQPVAYPYLFYYVPMDAFPIYTNARTAMFAKSPPDFYYRYIGEVKYYSPGLPKNESNNYVELMTSIGPSGLYIRKNYLSQITFEQWKLAKELGFYRPK